MPKEPRVKNDAYARAGVDLAKVRSIHRSIADALATTFQTRRGKFGEPVIGIGHYAGLIDIGGGRLLGLHTDGVGTKVLIAQRMKKFDTVGIDCIAMTVNDLVCLGCEPVALLDYIALERENDELVVELSKGLVKGAKESGAAIVGGETAIMGDLVKGFNGDGFDLVSMGVGVVKRDELIDGRAIEEGDAVVGIGSSGLHSNGYTLARRIVRDHSLNEKADELGETIGEALLRPTEIYAKPTLETIRKCEVHGIGHITGGAFTKLTRLLGGRKLQFRLDPIDASEAPPIFRFLQREGDVSEKEMYQTFNMGVGLCLVAPSSEVDAVLRAYRKRGLRGIRMGTVKAGEGVFVGRTRIA